MKTVKLHGIKQLQLHDDPIPVMGQGQALISLKAVGICGSDVHYFNKGRIGSDTCVYPQSLGHEPAGTVARSFAGGKFKEGDRVAIEPAKPCGSCEHCVTGHSNRCPRVRFLGSPGMPGAFSEFLVLDESQLAAIPDSMTFEEAAALEPLGVAYHALCLAGLKPGESVAIFGAGPIGLLTLAMARACGAGETFIFDKLAYRLEFAKNIYGVSHAVNVNQTDPIEYIRQQTANRGVDICFEAAGQQQTFNWTFEATRIGGRALIIGIPEEDTFSINPHIWRRREMEIRNVRRSNRALETCIDLVNRKVISIDKIITHRFPITAIADAFEMVGNYRDGVLRAMVVM